MTIRYVPNDSDGSTAHRRITPTAGRPGATVRFTLASGPPEQIYNGNDENFLHWQVRESALQTLAAWDELRGSLSAWKNGSSRLDLIPNFGVGLQAEYNQQALRFYRWEIGGTTFVGASTDAVAHEVGHALLDAIRPDLWNSANVEIVAFHEAFADCMAVIVALFDGSQRKSIFNAASSPDRVFDFSDSVSTLAESVANAYRRSFPPNNASATPRNANNRLKWAFPHTLPRLAVRANLSSEPHSFSRVFTGCFFDCIRNIYANSASTSANLRKATLIAGKLLINAVENAPLDLQFYRSIGNAMFLADQSAHAGAHQTAITTAFGAHNIDIGGTELVSRFVTLEGIAPPISAGQPVGLVAESHEHLCDCLGMPKNTRFGYRKVKLGDKRLVHTTFCREISLSKIHYKLRGTRLRLLDSVLLDVKKRRHILMDTLSDHKSATEHAYCLVETLLENEMLMVDRRILRKGKPALTKQAAQETLKQRATFSIRKRGGKKYLTRIRCICHARH